MKKRKYGILIIITTIIFVIVSFVSATLIEYYYVKSADRLPILAIKSESVAKQYTKYTALFYKVYKCYSDNIIIRGSNKDNPYCPRVIRYNLEDYYINYHNIKISKKNFQMIFDVSSTFSEIENFITYQDLENSKLIAEEYNRMLHMTLEKKIINNEEVFIEVFQEHVKINKYGDYEWKYQNDDSQYYKCMKDNLFKDYDNETCTGEWKKLGYSDKWCELAKNSSIYLINTLYKENCE